MNFKNTIFVTFFICLQIFAFSQNKAIYLENPSFEGISGHSQLPGGWYDCGFPGESPPDTQPDPMFQVTMTAYNGETYLGLVVRDNNTWESVSQRLSLPLLPDQCYGFSFYVARSESYISLDRFSLDKEINYIIPTIIRIWGGNEYCDRVQLLGETDLITDNIWQKNLSQVMKPIILQ